MDSALLNLCKALGKNHIRIYEWIRNNIRTEFYRGCKRGAYLTFLERAGNDMDQCALLGALLKLAGYSPTYSYGMIWVPRYRVTTVSDEVGAYEWLGVDDDAGALNLLRSFSTSGQTVAPESQTYPGIGTATTGTLYPDGYFFFTGMWLSLKLSADTNAPTLIFHPSIKPHAIGRKPSVVPASYSLGGVWDAALATADGRYSPAISPSLLRSHLTDLSIARSNSIRTSATDHDLGGPELARHRAIQPTVIVPSSGQKSFPKGVLKNDATAVVQYDGIPKSWVYQIYVRAGTVQVWFETAELQGRLLRCDFEGSGAAVLRVDGVEIGRDTSGAAMTSIDLQVAISLPPSFFPNADLYSYTAAVLRQKSVAITYCFGRTTGRLQAVQQSIAAVEAQSAASVTTADRLQLIGLQFVNQVNEVSTLAASSLDHEYERAMHAGFVSFVDRTGLDFGINAGDYVPRSAAAMVRTKSTTSVGDLLTGALEGAVLEQATGARAFGAPTVVDYAARPAYLIDSANAATIDILVNCDNSTLGAGAVARITQAIAPNSGRKVLLLSDSNVSYTGSSPATALGGYYEIYPNGGVATQLRGANGGLTSATNAGTASPKDAAAASPTNSTKTNQTQPLSTSSDPVDLSNGAFLKDDTDMVLGTGAEPTGLKLTRHYNSARRLSDPTGLGRGWTHGYHIQAVDRSPTDFEAERTGVDDVLPILIAAKVISDAVFAPEDEMSARSWLVASTAAAWAADQLIKSRASITMGSRTFEFTRRPDGTYSPPGSLTASLTPTTAGRKLAFRHGNTIEFGSDGLFTSITDPYANTLTATYETVSGMKWLKTVKDAYNRTFTFAYIASGTTRRLNTVTDSTGRSVEYDTATTGLFKFKDAEGKTLTLETTDYLLSKVSDARGRVVVENEYDSWQRVSQQKTFGDDARTTILGIAPGYGMERDPGPSSSAPTTAVRVYFDARGRKVFAVDQLNRIAQWKYDGVDRLVEAISPGLASTKFEYDASHVMTKETNPLQYTRTITPDSEHRPWIVGSFEPNRSTTILYHAATVGTTTVETADPTTITTAGGIVTTFGYDTQGRLIEKLVPPASAATKYLNFDGYGNPRTISYPKADANGAVTYPDGNQDLLTYNARGDVIDFTGRNGEHTVLEQNKRRQPTAVYREYVEDGVTLQTVAKTVYDDSGDIDTVTEGGSRNAADPENPVTLDAGRTSTHTYDALGHLLTVKQGSPAITVLTQQYYANGLLWTSTDALNRTTTFFYDEARRLIRTKDHLYREVETDYDSDGRVNSTTTPLLNVSGMTFDLAGRPQLATAQLSSATDTATVSYGFDKDGRPKSISNRGDNTKKHEWTYVETPTERKVTSKTPEAKSTTLESDVKGRPLKLTKPKTSQVTNFEAYDPEGRLTKRTDGIGTTVIEYWPNGLLWKVSENGKTTIRTYDDLNRLATYNDGENNLFRYAYYPDGRLKTLHYPVPSGQTAKSVNYEYDTFGRLWKVRDWNVPVRTTTYTYDDLGRVKRIDRPNNTSRRFTYNDSTTPASGVGINEVDVGEYRADNSVIWFVRLHHDADGRIESTFHNPALPPFTNPADGATFDFDNRLLTWNNLAVGHDDNGNMTSGPLPSGAWGNYHYDARDRLSDVTPAGAPLPTALYRYNPDGLRVEVSELGSTTTYAVDPNAALSRTLVKKSGTTATYYLYGLGLLYEETNAATRTYHYDHLGSTVALTDNAGAVVGRAAYSSFGTMIGTTTVTDTPFLLHGGLGVMTDANGLNYMRARYYNARLMRFCNADPIGFDGGLNHYAFGGNNPISFVDPWGMEAKQAGQTVMMDPFSVKDTRRARDYVQGYYDPFGGSHMSFCMSCHDGTPAANFYKQQAVLANALDWRVIVYEQTLALVLGGVFGRISENLAAMNQVRMVLQANRAAGAAWEVELMEMLEQSQTNVRAQITIRSNGPSRLRVRLDAVGNDEAGAIHLTDGKASSTAPLTTNQTIVYPELPTYGGTVVGAGKPPFTRGTVIPPTTVDIIRKQ